MGRVIGWWFDPAPKARVAVLRTIVYLFVFVDVLLTTEWVATHGTVPEALYQPIFIARVLPLPVPTEQVVLIVEVALLVVTGIAALGRLPRAAGSAVALLYLQWMVIAMSYGKVDHDRFAFLVALAVLPTVGAARFRDKAPNEAAGWALRCIQVAVVATYFLATFAKLRFGGLEWLNSATLMRAVLRADTPIADLLEHAPQLLHAAQWVLVAMELASPLLLWPGRVGRVALDVAIAFHVLTFLSISIIFLPHVVCLLAFVPLERLAIRGRHPAVARPEGAPAGADNRA